MASYLDKTFKDVHVSSQEVDALHKLAMLCALDVCALVIFAAFNSLPLSPYCVVFFWAVGTGISFYQCGWFRWEFWAVGANDILLVFILIILPKEGLLGQGQSVFFLVAPFGMLCCLYVLYVAGLYLSIRQLRFNHFLHQNQHFISVLLKHLSFSFLGFCVICEIVSTAKELQTLKIPLNEAKRDEQLPIMHFPVLALCVLFLICLFVVNERIMAEVDNLFNYVQAKFLYLRNTAEAHHLFDEKTMSRFEQIRSDDWLLNRFDFEKIKAEVGGRRGSLPGFLVEEERLIQNSDKFHLRALSNLSPTAYGVVSAKQNDVLEVEGKSHTEFWWKARLVQRCKKREILDENEIVIPSKIKLHDLRLTGVCGQSRPCLSNCAPFIPRKLCPLAGLYLVNKHPLTMELSDLYFHKTYELVELREGFRRRSLVLLGEPRYTKPIADALANQKDSPFIAGCHIPKENGKLWWSRLQGYVRDAIRNKEIPIITMPMEMMAKTGAAEFRTSEFAPLVVLFRYPKDLCKNCDLMFDEELNRFEPSAAAAELEKIWTDRQQGPQWIPSQWLTQ